MTSKIVMDIVTGSLNSVMCKMLAHYVAVMQNNLAAFLVSVNSLWEPCL